MLPIKAKSIIELCRASGDTAIRAMYPIADPSSIHMAPPNSRDYKFVQVVGGKVVQGFREEDLLIME
jgi:hypothetical protein